MSAGWVRLWRKVHESSLYKSLTSKQRDVMIQCLLLANHEENEWVWQGEDFVCKPGQFITSLSNLQQKCAKDVKIQSVRSALLKLEKHGFLTNKSTKTGRLITICKWETYQHKDYIVNKDKNKEPTKSQQRTNKELTTNNNDKNDKNEKSKYAFDIFWDLYDKKKDRKKCEKKWDRISESERERIMEFIPVYHKSEPNPQYRKYPYTFLNSEIWNDDWESYRSNGKDETRKAVYYI